MGFRDLIVKKGTKTAEKVVLETKAALKKRAESNVETKSNAIYALGKLAILGLIFFVAGRDVTTSETTKAQSQIPHITINNYIHERRDNDD